MTWFLVLTFCYGQATECNVTTIPAAYVNRAQCVAAGEYAVETQRGVKRFNCIAYNRPDN